MIRGMYKEGLHQVRTERADVHRRPGTKRRYARLFTAVVREAVVEVGVVAVDKVPRRPPLMAQEVTGVEHTTREQNASNDEIERVIAPAHTNSSRV